MLAKKDKFPQVFFSSHASKWLLISVTTAGSQWQTWTNLSCKVKTIMSKCRARQWKGKHMSCSCTHHLQQSKIYFPATCKTEGREIQKFLANKGESPGAVVPIIGSLKYLRWSFCFHYVECWLFILERINICKGLHRFHFWPHSLSGLKFENCRYYRTLFYEFLRVPYVQISLETQKSKRFILPRKKCGRRMQEGVTFGLGFKNEKDFIKEAIAERSSGLK